MKVLQTIPNFGAKSGGTSTCTYDLLNALHKQECNINLLTLMGSDPSDRLMGNNEEWIITLPNDSKIPPYSYSKGIKNFLETSEYDLYHTNGIWMHCNHTTCSIARKKRKPYIITTHGMLYPQALARSAWKKKLMAKLFFDKDIMKAICIHATCQQEMEYVRQFGYKGPIAVIPNPVNIPNYIETLNIAKEQTVLISHLPKKIGFLGRLHPRKKVENLLYGAAMLPQQDFEIIIMGKGDDMYEQFLKSETKKLGLTNVNFTGFVNGIKKYEMLSKLSALFVPSDFENFGMIITEALICKTPVVASLGTPWKELNTYQCGWWIDCTPQNIAQTISQIIEMPKHNLLAMGDNGYKLIMEKYTADKVAEQMKKLYEWILNQAPKPNFVYED
ncbi:MAG: glycosyltransferase [Dysgonomonas sp.]|nr:glycosyltransferase [Dysgonomonas sp.]